MAEKLQPRKPKVPTSVVLLAAASFSGLAGGVQLERSFGNERASRQEMQTTVGHFAVECFNGPPQIEKIYDSGLVPKVPKGMNLGVVVDIACAEGAPVITQDTQKSGACLGYSTESHLAITVYGPNAQGFYVAPADEQENRQSIVAVSETASDTPVSVTDVEIHRHNLSEPGVMREYLESGCAEGDTPGATVPMPHRVIASSSAVPV